MARAFWLATAERVVSVVDAVWAGGGAITAEQVARFIDVPKDSTEKALDLAVDLGLLRTDGANYKVSSPLCRFLSSPNLAQKAAVIRVLLESYQPFLIFRERMGVVGSVGEAAEQTRNLLDLDLHREDVTETLLSLGTYSQALITKGGGRYETVEMGANPLEALANACQDQVAAEVRIRAQLGATVAPIVSRDEVLVPLADALLKSNGDPRGAVMEAGNAVDSYLVHEAGAAGVGLANATGINAKIDRFVGANAMPKILGFFGKYLGHLRNAADHGVDSDIGAAWEVSPNTGVEYVFVACSFIRAVALRANVPPTI